MWTQQVLSTLPTEIKKAYSARFINTIMNLHHPSIKNELTLSSLKFCPSFECLGPNRLFFFQSIACLPSNRYWCYFDACSPKCCTSLKCSLSRISNTIETSNFRLIHSLGKRLYGYLFDVVDTAFSY